MCVRAQVEGRRAGRQESQHLFCILPSISFLSPLHPLPFSLSVCSSIPPPSPTPHVSVYPSSPCLPLSSPHSLIPYLSACLSLHPSSLHSFLLIPFLFSPIPYSPSVCLSVHPFIPLSHALRITLQSPFSSPSPVPQLSVHPSPPHPPLSLPHPLSLLPPHPLHPHLSVHPSLPPRPVCLLHSLLTACSLLLPPSVSAAWGAHTSVSV